MKLSLIHIIVILLISSCSYLGFNKQSWKKFTNEAFNFSIEYPENWELKEDFLRRQFFVNEPPSKKQKVLTNVEIKISNDINLSLDVRVELKDLGLKGKNNYTDITVISKKRTLFKNIDAYEYICEGDYKQLTMKWKQIILVRDSNYYEITTTSTKKEYDKMKKTTDQIINSFSWLK